MQLHVLALYVLDYAVEIGDFVTELIGISVEGGDVARV